MDIQALNTKFTPKGNIFFKKGHGDLIIAKIDNKYALCEISLYGGQILSYEPHGSEGVLWLSKKSYFEKGKAIRGGIPICFPWFGPHKDDPSKPQHGFARLIDWEVDHVMNLPDSSTRIILKCSDNEFTRKYWPYSFHAKLIVLVKEVLEISLEVSNTGNEIFEYTDALHSYFKISDPENISVLGLLDVHYLDGTDNNVKKTQQDEFLLIGKEENRRYIGHSGDCAILDSGFNRKITISKTGSHTTVVWNPWNESGKKMADMAHDGYKHMLCIEPANAYNDIITLKPGESFRLSTTIQCERL